MDEHVDKKKEMVADASKALNWIQQSERPTDHTDVLMMYVETIIRIQKSELWIAQFNAINSVKHRRRCKAPPKPKLCKASVQMDKKVFKLLDEIMTIVGKEAIQDLQDSHMDINVGEIKVSHQKTKSGGVVFNLIHE